MDLGDQITLLTQLVKIYHAMRDVGSAVLSEGEAAGLSLDDALMLIAVGAYAPTTPKAICEKTDRLPSSVSTSLKHLHAKKLVRKNLKAANRRSYLVSLTPQGEIRSESVRRRLALLLSQTLGFLTESEQKELSRVLTKLRMRTFDVRQQVKQGEFEALAPQQIEYRSHDADQ